MALPNDNVSMALYCDFENVALGVLDAKYNKFDITPVLDRLLLKGSIVVKKAYCDWDRYKEFKPQMHEASFELIEIPHVRQSGKNSADIRLVVDALDLCYTKAHVNTFVIISGDSDFSPLVSKLRENAKYVIGVGVKNSTSDLLIANCDEFIFIDDLVRESRRTTAKREVRKALPVALSMSGDDQLRKHDLEVRKSRAIDIAAETFEALMVERGDSGKIWASTLKQAIKRRKPDFNETYFGFRTFGNLLEEAQSRGLIEIGRDDKSGVYVYRSTPITPNSESAASEAGASKEEKLRNNGRTRRKQPAKQATAPIAQSTTAVPETAMASAPPEQTAAAEIAADNKPRRSSRTGRKPAQQKEQAAVPQASSAMPIVAAETTVNAVRKPAARARRPPKAKVAPPAAE